MRPPPAIPEGPDFQSVFNRWVRDELVSQGRPQEAFGSLVYRTTRGTGIIPEGKSVQGFSVNRYRLKNVRGDYLVCRSWNGTDEGTSDVFIAKEELHRESLSAETILGVGHTYVYADGATESWAVGDSGAYNRIRTDDNGDTTESQRITPPWRENEVILAMPCNTGVTTIEDDGSASVRLHIIGRSCQWAGPVA